RIGQFIGGHVSRKKLLEAICQDVVGTELFQSSWIGLTENGQFNLVAQAGLDDDIIKLEEYLRKTRLPQCSQYALTTTGPFLGGPNKQGCESCPLSAVTADVRLCMRLEYGGTVYGTWTVASDDELLGDPQEQALFAEAAKDIALALHNIELTEQGVRVQEEIRTLNTRLQRHVTQLAALHSIDSAINASMDLSVVMRIIMDEITSQLDADAINVMSYNPRQQVLESIASRGFRGESIQRARVRIGQEYAGRVALEHRMVSVIDLHRASVDSGDAAEQTYSAEGFVSYCGIPLISKGKIRGVLEIYQRQTLNLSREWVGFLEAIAGQMAIAIDVAKMFDNLQRTNFELVVAYDATIEGWSREMDLRDASTQGHCRRVADLAVQLAGKLNLPDWDIVHLRRGALLHDIGKMSIPDSILHKAGPLSEDEWVIMKKHTTRAYETLLPITFLRPALDIPYCHHEKWDGTGYPRGLKGEVIPLSARIFAVVDVWDAIRYDRPYRPAWSRAKALEHMRLLAGNHLDPQIVDAFLEMVVAGEQE
ncbi:MAG: HD domain-containing protein, partial [Planctomycetaceae bacterium]